MTYSKVENLQAFYVNSTVSRTPRQLPQLVWPSSKRALSEVNAIGIARTLADDECPSPMPLPLHLVPTDHNALSRAATKAANIADPVAVNLDQFRYTVLMNARRGVFMPVEGAFIRDWDRSFAKYSAGMRFGIRLYTIKNIRFARCVAHHDQNEDDA